MKDRYKDRFIEEKTKLAKGIFEDMGDLVIDYDKFKNKFTTAYGCMLYDIWEERYNFSHFSCFDNLKLFTCDEIKFLKSYIDNLEFDGNLENLYSHDWKDIIIDVLNIYNELQKPKLTEEQKKIQEIIDSVIAYCELIHEGNMISDTISLTNPWYRHIEQLLIEQFNYLLNTGDSMYAEIYRRNIEDILHMLCSDTKICIAHKILSLYKGK